MKSFPKLLAIALMASAAQIASAVNYSPSKLLLVFHKSGYNDVIFGIGPVTSFTGVSSGTVVPVSYDSSVVSANFGSLTGVSFAVVGENDSSSKVWLSDADFFS